MGLTNQTWVWAGGYLFYIVGLLVCFRFAKERKKEREETTSDLTNIRRLKWLLWGFIPSSLMLGVTQFISTDIAPIPLFWLVPLSLYLVTFIIAFSNKFPKLPTFWGTVFLLSLLIPVYEISMPITWKLLVHNAVFFFVALHFHRRLADDRPPVDRLTEFFVLLSVGGALGGLFNGVAAPFLFVQKIEYDIMLVVAILSIVPIYSITGKYKPQTFVSAALCGSALGGIGAFLAGIQDWFVYAIVPMPFVLYGVMQIRYANVWKLNLAVTVGVLITVGIGMEFGKENYELARSFYSTYRVFEGEHQGRKTIKLASGGTSHGEEVLDVPGKPFAYYARESCFGEVMDRRFSKVNLVGLGAGAAAAYAIEGSEFDFFEIDQTVVTLARKHFSYLKRCGERCNVEVGDGRRLFDDKSDGTYDMIVLDAYNSDAVPTHLMTTEAFETYRAKLKPHGVIAFHVSSRYLALEDVVSSNSKTLGLTSVMKTCLATNELEKVGPIFSNRWVVVGAQKDLTYLVDKGWAVMQVEGKTWTDDFTNIASVFRWE